MLERVVDGVVGERARASESKADKAVLAASPLARARARVHEANIYLQSCFSQNTLKEPHPRSPMALCIVRIIFGCFPIQRLEAKKNEKCGLLNAKKETQKATCNFLAPYCLFSLTELMNGTPLKQQLFHTAIRIT